MTSRCDPNDQPLRREAAQDLWSRLQMICRQWNVGNGTFKNKTKALNRLCSSKKKLGNFYFKNLYRQMGHGQQAESATLENHYSHQLPGENAPFSAMFITCTLGAKAIMPKRLCPISPKPSADMHPRTNKAPLSQTMTSRIREQVITGQQTSKNQDYRQQGARIRDTQQTLPLTCLSFQFLTRERECACRIIGQNRGKIQLM